MKANFNTEPLIEIWGKGNEGRSVRIAQSKVNVDEKYKRIDLLVHNPLEHPIEKIKIIGNGDMLYFDDISLTTISNNHPYKDEIIKMDPFKDNNGEYVVTWNDNVASKLFIDEDIGGENQKWIKTYDENKKAYQFKSLENPKKVLAIDDNSILLNVVDNTFSDTQYWIVEKTKDKFYQISNFRYNLLAIDLLNGNLIPKNSIQVASKRDANSDLLNAQKFYFSN
ncbi:hypothetical protein CN403_32945 [Bacillus cereus]|nr:hypothetical protein CN403_32945 [Bacillus cereus]